MTTCRACGGVLGRDCYNEQDCLRITANNQIYDEQEAEYFRYENQKMKADILLLREKLKVYLKYPQPFHRITNNQYAEILSAMEQTDHYEVEKAAQPTDTTYNFLNDILDDLPY